MNSFNQSCLTTVVFHYPIADMVQRDIKIISLADTVGIASSEQISFALNTLIPKYPLVEIGVHLHSTSHNWQQKTEAGFKAECVRFDGALKGIGGCPMAKDELVGNMNMEKMIGYFKQQEVLPEMDFDALQNSLSIAEKIFSH
jgi:hydroxymethylglutaryl-CoA lyase